MKICIVEGHVWATKKDSTLEGLKFMVVRDLKTDDKASEDIYVAADMVGAGVGEKVLVVSGSTARRAVGGDECPVDAAIVGIIDTIEVDREKAENAKNNIKK